MNEIISLEYSPNRAIEEKLKISTRKNLMSDDRGN
jgi:hypothetical protein